MDFSPGQVKAGSMCGDTHHRWLMEGNNCFTMYVLNNLQDTPSLLILMMSGPFP